MSEDWTPEEWEALQSLPRERIPPADLEERTVDALKRRRLLRSSSELRLGGSRRMGIAAAAVAAIAFFAGGLAMGQWLGARQTATAIAELFPHEAERAAAVVQRTGSAHAAALAGLVDAVQATQTPDEREEARQVAEAALRAAALEVARLSPNDPLAAQILQGLERTGPNQVGPEAGRSVVWF